MTDRSSFVRGEALVFDVLDELAVPKIKSKLSAISVKRLCWLAK